MKRRDFLKKTGVGAVATSTIPHWQKVKASTPNTTGKPNILFFGVDSVKAKSLSVYGNKYCKTPNIDRLAQKGTAIRNTFCQMPKSVPSRSLMLTGRYPHVDGLRALSGRLKEVERTKHFVMTKENKNSLKVLLDNGYTLCHKGVNHLVSWDIYEDWFEHQSEWESLKKNKKSIPVTENDEELIRAMYGGKVPEDFDIETTADAEYTRQMCGFLENYQEDKPFFAYLDLRAPHPTYFDYPFFEDYYKKLKIADIPKSDIETVAWNEKVYRQTYGLENMADEKWKKIAKAYYSAISFSDMLIGRVLDTLEQANLTKNTIVIFTADHGDFAGDHGCTEKHDPFLYDSLTHLPFIISYPGKIIENKMVDTMMEQIDIAPTILDLCGLEVPEWIQGKSIVPVVTGMSDKHKDVVFSQGGVEREAIDRSINNRGVLEEFSNGKIYYYKQKVILDYPDFMMRAKMVRTKEHKYIYRLNGHHEFYDLKKDPHEINNIIDEPEYKPLITEMREHLINWMITNETNLPLMSYAYA